MAHPKAEIKYHRERDGSWLILAPARQQRPHQAKGKVAVCPFDPGNEQETPPEVARSGGGRPNRPGWRVRVVPNLYPITSRHEVVIHSPDHQRDISGLEPSHVLELLRVFRQRWQVLSQYGRPLIFNNHGLAAGASVPHPHSQIAVIPKHIRLEAPLPKRPDNVALNGQNLVVFCPRFSIWPYETWIQSTARQRTNFGETDDETLKELAVTLKKVLAALLAKVPDLAYNFYIYPGRPWYLRIMGRSDATAGFELGSGIAVNTIPPQEARGIIAAVADQRLGDKA